MPILNGIDLGSDIHIENEHSLDRVQSEMVRSRSGAPIRWEQSISAFSFDLVGHSNKGILRKSVLDQLQSMADTPNSEYTLEYDGKVKTVWFRNWEGSVISGTPLGPREKMTDDDIYTDIRIKLMEV